MLQNLGSNCHLANYAELANRTGLIGRRGKNERRPFPVLVNMKKTKTVRVAARRGPRGSESHCKDPLQSPHSIRKYQHK